MTRLTRTVRAVRRAVLGRRRTLAALLTVVAVTAALRVVSGPPPPTTAVLTAARDLPAGSVVRAGDLREVPFTPGSVPQGTLPRHELVGRTTAGPIRAGEALTDAAVVRGSLLDGYPGLVAAPVRIGDAETVRLLRVGDHIDLVAAEPQGFRATVVARDVPILALPRVDDKANFSGVRAGTGRLIIVAIREETALSLAQAGVSAFISVVINR